MARQHFGEPSRPRRRVRRTIRTFDLAGARQRLPLAKAILADYADRHAAYVKALRTARSTTTPGAAEALRQARVERQAARREAHRLGMRLLAGAGGGVFPTLVNGALAYLVLLHEDDDIRAWRYRDEPRLRPIPAAWHAAAPQAALAHDGMPL